MNEHNLVKLDYLNEFASLFVNVPDALSSSGSTEQIQKHYERLITIYSEESDPLLSSLFDEIEINLFRLSDQNRVIYLKKIFRSLAIVLGYFDRASERYRRLLQEYYTAEINFDDATIAEKYILTSRYVLAYFSECLDEACLAFSLNIDDIQKQLGLYLPGNFDRYERRWDILQMYGHVPLSVVSTENLNESIVNLDAKYTAPKPSIFIALDARESLLEALDPYVVSSIDKEGLKTLIDGGDPSYPIKIECLQNILVHVFRQAKDKGKITDKATRLRDWLVKWFRVKYEATHRELNSSTVYDGLTKDIDEVKPADRSIITVRL